MMRRRARSGQASFSGVAFLFGLVAMVVGAFLVGNTLAMTVGERTREIGLLRAAGTTSRQVLGLFLRQGLALGIAGSVLGVVAASCWRRHDRLPGLDPRRAVVGLPIRRSGCCWRSRSAWA